MNLTKLSWRPLNPAVRIWKVKMRYWHNSGRSAGYPRIYEDVVNHIRKNAVHKHLPTTTAWGTGPEIYGIGKMVYEIHSNGEIIEHNTEVPDPNFDHWHYEDWFLPEELELATIAKAEGRD